MELSTYQPFSNYSYPTLYGIIGEASHFPLSNLSPSPLFNPSCVITKDFVASWKGINKACGLELLKFQEIFITHLENNQEVRKQDIKKASEIYKRTRKLDLKLINERTFHLRKLIQTHKFLLNKKTSSV